MEAFIRSAANGNYEVATVPAWQSETAKPRSRGRWGKTIHQCFKRRQRKLTYLPVMIEGGLQTFGVASGQLIGYGFFFVKTQAQWRAPVGIQLIPAVIVLVFINFLPESPRWLVKHGQITDVSCCIFLIEACADMCRCRPPSICLS